MRARIASTICCGCPLAWAHPARPAACGIQSIARSSPPKVSTASRQISGELGARLAITFPAQTYLPLVAPGRVARAAGLRIPCRMTGTLEDVHRRRVGDEPAL